MAPGNDTDTVIVCVNLFYGFHDFVRALARRQVLYGNGNEPVNIIRHFFGVLRNVRKDVVAVKRLRTRKPINYFFFHFKYP